MSTRDWRILTAIAIGLVLFCTSAIVGALAWLEVIPWPW